MSQAADRSPPDRSRFSGICAMLFALFDKAESLDKGAMQAQAEACISVGVHGIGVLGLATEVGKLSLAERFSLIEWTAEFVGGRVPLAVTIAGGSAAEQIEQVRCAEAAGASWLILQPPGVGSYDAAEYAGFFAHIAEATDLPVGVQNAPAYLGRGLSTAEIQQLFRRHPNISLLKGEGPADQIAALIAATGGNIPVFNGRGGLEMVDNLRAGCAGLILAPDIVDYAVLAYEQFRAGDEAGADATYAAILPAVTFSMQSIESLICYGKRIFARRIGIPVHDRAPALRPSAFGLSIVERQAAALGDFAPKVSIGRPA